MSSSYHVAKRNAEQAAAPASPSKLFKDLRQGSIKPTTTPGFIAQTPGKCSWCRQDIYAATDRVDVVEGDTLHCLCAVEARSSSARQTAPASAQSAPAHTTPLQARTPAQPGPAPRRLDMDFQHSCGGHAAPAPQTPGQQRHHPSHVPWWCLCWDYVVMRLMLGAQTVADYGDIHAYITRYYPDLRVDLQCLKASRDKVLAFCELPFPLRSAIEALDEEARDALPAHLLRKLGSTPPEELQHLDRELEECMRAGVGAGQDYFVRPGMKLSQAVKLLIKMRKLEYCPVSRQYRTHPSANKKAVTMTLYPSIASEADVPRGKTGHGSRRRAEVREVHLHRLSSALSNMLLRDSVVGAHARLLQVTMMQPLRGEASRQAQATAERALKAGVVFAGRLYEPLVVKHDEAVVWFVATKTLANEQCDGVPAFEPLSLEAILDRLGAFRYIPSMDKMLNRLQLLTTPTIPLLVPPDDVYYVDDLEGRNPDGSPSLGADAKPIIMTDGNGLFGSELVSQVPLVHHGVKAGDKVPGPSIMQVRARDPRGQMHIIIKGTLTPCGYLPGSTVVIPMSMVKCPPAEVFRLWLQPAYPGWAQPGYKLFTVKRPAAAAAAAAAADSRSQAAAPPPPAESQSVEIAVGTSWFEATDARLSKVVLLLLEHGGVPGDMFKRMMEVEVARWADVGVDHDSALQLASSLKAEDVTSMLLAGVGMRRQPEGQLVFAPDYHLRQLIQRLRADKMRKLSEMKLPLRLSYRVVGVPDWTGSVPEGCVVPVGEREVLLEQEVLVYRDPALHPDSVRRARAIPPPPAFKAFYGRVHAGLFFSTQGKESLAQTMATGDFDGDLYLVIADPQIVGTYKQQRLAGTGQVLSSQGSSQRSSQGGIRTPPIHHAAGAAPTSGSGHTPPPPRQRGGSSGGGSSGAATAADVAVAAAVCLPEEDAGVQEVQAPACCERTPSNGGALVAPTNLHTHIHNYFRKAQELGVVMGQASNLWQSWAAANGVACPQCLDLDQIYSDALDSLKTGKKVEVPPGLKNAPEGGTSIVSQLCQMVRAHPLLDPDELDMELLKPDPDISTVEGEGEDPALRARMKWREEKWRGQLSAWNRRWCEKLSWQESVYGELDLMSRASRKRAKAAKDLTSRDLSAAFRSLMPQLPQGALCPSQELIEEAVALYRAVYDMAAMQVDKKGARHTMAWAVAGDVLCHLKAWRMNKSERLPCTVARQVGLFKR